jgi:hypothetical protein
MSNRRKQQKSSKTELVRKEMANKWYWRWLPNRSWQSILFIGLGSAALILMVSWFAGLPPELNIRAALTAAIWMFFTALVYAKNRALAHLST